MSTSTTMYRHSSHLRTDEVLYFEWARCFGAAAVVMIHVTSGIMDNSPIAEVGIVRALVWSELQVILLRWAVPVFFMMSGALLLDPNRRVTWVKVWGYAKRMMIVLATWGLVFSFLQRFFLERSFSAGVIVGTIFDLLSNQGFSHLWYVYALIGIYLLLPVLRAWVANSSQQEQSVLLAVLFVFTCVVPTLNAAAGTSFVSFVWVASPVFYVLLGYFAHNRLEVDARLLIVGLAALTVCVALKAFAILMVGDYWKWLHGPACPFEAAWSLCIFLLTKRYLDVPYARGGFIDRSASLSLGIYVIHPLFINLLYKAIGIGPWSLPPVVFELTVWAMAYFGSALVVSLERRIPLVRNIM